MSQEHEVLFIAGDPSGDLHAAQMGRELAQLVSVRLTGAGGPRMREAGFVTDFASDDWSAIGIWEALPKGLHLLVQERRMVRRVAQRKPALVVVVDFGAFNVRFARRLRRFRPEQRIMYYFPPSSWQRRPRDWSFLQECVDVVATPFRWSAEQLRDSGVRAYWVGHPAVERFSGHEDAAAYRREHDLPEGEPVIGLMAGSRRAERSHIGPQLLGAARLLRRELPQAHFLWSLWQPEKRRRLDAAASAEDFITPLTDSRTLIIASDLVIAASGTATLECAAALRPLVMVYRGSWAVLLQARLMDLGTEYFAMPSIIAQRKIVPELLQRDCNPQRIAREVLALHTDEACRSQMLEDLAAVRAELGPPGASRRAAEIAAALISGDIDDLPDELAWPGASTR